MEKHPRIRRVHQFVVLAAERRIVERGEHVDSLGLVLLAFGVVVALCKLFPRHPPFGSIEGREEESSVLRRCAGVGGNPLGSVVGIEHPSLVPVADEVAAVRTYHPSVRDFLSFLVRLIAEILKLEGHFLKTVRTWDIVLLEGTLLHLRENQRVVVRRSR